MQEASAYPSAQKNCPSQAFKQAFGQTPDKIRRQYAHVNANSRAAPPLHSTWLLWMVPFFVAMLCFHLSDTVAEPKPESEAWKINGALAAVQDTNTEVQVKGLEKWGGLKSSGTISKVAEVMKDKDKDGSVRSAAVKALGAMGGASKDLVPELVNLLSDPDRNIRFAAIDALGAVGFCVQGADLKNCRPLEEA